MNNDCPLWFDETMKGGKFLLYTRPCIYAWFRPEEGCLYVGMSRHGIARPLGNHHIISKQVVLPTDTFKYFFPPIKDIGELEDIERNYIRALNPKYNTQTYEPGTKSNNVHQLPEKVYTKEELAEALFSKMPEHTLLENPSDYTDTELKSAIEFERDWKRKYEQWKRMK